jgi:tripartite-type tricarboxylate transporter receptor subunit TctC
VNAALAGEVKVSLTTPSDAINAFVSSGKLKMLAVSSVQRSPMLPNVPAISETLPGFSVNAWFGLAAPAGTPPEVVAKLNDAINKSIAEPVVQAKLKALGMSPNPGSAAEFGEIIRADQQLWIKVVQQGKIDAE